MKIPEKDWNDYITRLAKLNQTAGQKMREYIDQHGTADTEALIRYAHALITKYGEGSAELACQMYDALAAAEGAVLPAAEPAATADFGEVARMVQATKESPSQLQSGVARLVKRAGADTTQKNAIRDGAEWAWVPHGDTCAFCLTLASRGWQRASEKLLKGGHAEHIHANCDCEFAVRFDGSTTVAGYDPEEYYRQYREAGSDVNAMRRIDYAARKDTINAQKRAAYAARKEAEVVALAKNPQNWETLLNRQSESYFKKLGDNQMALLSDVEKDALRDWSGGYYGRVNSFMRFGHDVPKETRKMAETIFDALEKTTIPDEIFAKREVSENAVDILLQSVPNWRENLAETIGKTIKDNGFFSTSPLESGGLSDDVKFIVKCPAGIHGVYMASVSYAEGEKELLLQAGYSFIIKDAEVRTDKDGTAQTVFWLEVIL